MSAVTSDCIHGWVLHWPDLPPESLAAMQVSLVSVSRR